MSYLGGVRHAETDEGEDAKFGGEQFASLWLNLFVGTEKRIEILHEMRMDVDECLVEVNIELFLLTLEELIAFEGTEQVVGLSVLGESEHVETETVETVDVVAAAPEVVGYVFLLDLVGTHQSFVHFMELSVGESQLLIGSIELLVGGF